METNLTSILNAQEKDYAKGYRGYVDFALGDAYNFNTDQLVSTNNMQWYSMLSTMNGYQLKNWFVGAGVGIITLIETKRICILFMQQGVILFEM